MAGATFRLSTLICALMLALAAVSMAEAASPVTIHGYLYEWSMLGIVTNATVELISSTGTHQQIVATQGLYNFNVSKGEYIIIARTAGTDILYARENLSITQDGDYVLDLIMFPSDGYEDLEQFDDITDLPIPEEPVDNSLNTILLIGGGVIALLAVGGAIAFLFLFKGKKREENPAEEPVSVVEAPPIDISDPKMAEDLKQVVSIIEKHGGRITQLDLRKSLPYSEAKVSLMLTDLENRGVIRKVKKGRGNVIILNKEDDRQ